jgi:hypothetical protein
MRRVDRNDVEEVTSDVVGDRWLFSTSIYTLALRPISGFLLSHRYHRYDSYSHRSLGSSLTRFRRDLLRLIGTI